MEEAVVTEEILIYQYDTTLMLVTDVTKPLTTIDITRAGSTAILIACPIAGALLFLFTMVLICAACRYYRQKLQQSATYRVEEIEMTEMGYASTTWPSLHHHKPVGSHRVDIRTYFDVNTVVEQTEMQIEQPQPSTGERTPTAGKGKLYMLMRLISGIAQRPGSRLSLSSLSSSQNNIQTDQGTGRKKKALSTSGVIYLAEYNEHVDDHGVIIPPGDIRKKKAMSTSGLNDLRERITDHGAVRKKESVSIIGLHLQDTIEDIQETEDGNLSNSNLRLENSRESNRYSSGFIEDCVFVPADEIDWSSMYF